MFTYRFVVVLIFEAAAAHKAAEEAEMIRVEEETTYGRKLLRR